ncbi:MFS transporter [Streptomyces sp. SID12501]|uniref:MFS transporter n=1 Tax=Streptomyces sp. SID12501 TaxID=2706042 RepID=A0A6B3BPK1_9ACTN|nr:MFS transporter [Streptomyces sp. SID12501]NEC86238.1 MFS transporter [Streptomyces sp. SID12501]
MSGSLLGLLRSNADFRRLFCASALSLTGDWFTFVALSGFVYHHTGSAGLTALLFAVNSLPGVLLIPIVGPLTDRFDRRRLRIACDTAAIVPVVGLLLAFHLGSVPLALGGLATLSVFAAVASPIPETVLPNMVSSKDLPLAQAALGSVYSSGLLVGAGLGGVVTAAWGSSATLIIDGASFAVSAVLIARIRRPFSTAAAVHRMRVWADSLELWRFVRVTPVVAAFLWLTVGLRLSYGMVGLLPVYALDRFDVGDAGVGALYMAQGVGAVLGPFLGRRLTEGSARRRLFVAGGALAIFGFGYLALAQVSHLGLGMAAALIGHLGVGACAILAVNGLQLASPDYIRGRVMVLVFGLSSGLQGVSALAVAPLAATLGMTGATHVLGVLAVAYAMFWAICVARMLMKRKMIEPDSLQSSAPEPAP